MVIAPFSSTFERRKAVDFSDTTMYTDKIAILYKKPHSDGYFISLFYKVSATFGLPSIAVGAVSIIANSVNKMLSR